MSLIYIRNIIGPNTDPWGTLLVTFVHLDNWPFITVLNNPLSHKVSSILRCCPSILKCTPVSIGVVCEALCKMLFSCLCVCDYCVFGSQKLLDNTWCVDGVVVMMQDPVLFFHCFGRLWHIFSLTHCRTSVKLSTDRLGGTNICEQSLKYQKK